MTTLGDVLYPQQKLPPSAEMDWEELLGKVKRQDRGALFALFERLNWPVFVLVSRIVQVPAFAEEITVDVFVDVFRRAREYDRSKCSVSAWVLNCARHLAMAFHKRRGAAGSQDIRIGEPAPALVDSLRERLAMRLAAQEGGIPAIPYNERWTLPAWDEVAPGISVRILSFDPSVHRVSMLVRLSPGTDYPPHTHAGTEELHLLEGELWIDDRKLYPGDYNHATPGTSDKRVWSETGCVCFLMTSVNDDLS